MSQEATEEQQDRFSTSPPSSPLRSRSVSPSFFNHRGGQELKNVTKPEKESEEDSGISESSSDHSPLISVTFVPTENEQSQGEGKKERLLMVAVQVFLPFLVAGFGTMFAGMLLDYVQHWKVYTDIGELFILVPALLGLKGNLEMTLASRLSTAANLGAMDSWKSRWKIAWGNLSLIQGQALVVAGLATLISLLLGLVSREHPNTLGLLLVGGASMSAACLASVLLGGIMIVIVMASKPLKINPDNIATPIAASLGDLITLTLLSVIAHGLYSLKNQSADETNVDKTIVISSVLCVVLLILIPVWLTLAYFNSFTKQVVYSGWIPVISAMLISSCGGLILSKTVKEFPGIAIYSPIINGVGGNLAAVQASRLSTALHKTGKPGTDSQDNSVRWWKRPHIRTIPLLVLMVIPASIIFLVVIKSLDAGHTTLSTMFLIAYLITAVLQVILLLAVTYWLVHLIWTFRFDPDNIAIPYLTALGDVLGTGLLAVAFNILWYLGDRDVDVGE